MLTGVWRRPTTYAAVVVVLALSGCSGDGDGAGTDEPPAPTVTETVTAAPTESATEQSTAPAVVAPDIEGPVVEQGQLSSPTGNIWCSLDPAVECEVRESSYDPLRKPADCQLDWADDQFWVNGSTGARGICRGDVTFTSRPPELAYGTTSVVGTRACQSTETAMTCWDTATGHGFRVSRETYDLF